METSSAVALTSCCTVASSHLSCELATVKGRNNEKRLKQLFDEIDGGLIVHL